MLMGLTPSPIKPLRSKNGGLQHLHPEFESRRRLLLNGPALLRTDPSTYRVKPTSTRDRSIASSRMQPNESGSNRTQTATKIATELRQDCVASDPGLAEIMDAWPKLPEAIRAGMLAMVRAANDRGF